MEPSQTVSLMLFVVGMLSTLTVLWWPPDEPIKLSSNAR